MSLPITYRWVYVGNLVIKHEDKTPEDIPKFSLEEVISIAKTRSKNNDHKEHNGKYKRLMSLTNISSTDNYYQFLAEVSNQNAVIPSVKDFETHEVRDFEKKDTEGGHYTAHVIIKKEADCNGNHLILVEKVPGISFSSLKDFFRWMCNDDRFKKTYNKDQIEKKYRPLFEIDGHQSSTIGEALRTQNLQDIEFVGHQQEDDGLDENGYVKETIHKTSLVVKRKIAADEAEGFLSKQRSQMHERFGKKVKDPSMFVRIKTASGIKKTAIQDDKGSILEQAFIQNEIIKDFDEELPPRYEGLNADVLRKMKNIIQQISSVS